MSAEKKKPVNGRAKGHGFENTIAKLFSEKFAPLNFKRTQASGAIVGGLNSRFTVHYSEEMLSAFIGDIFPANEADVMRTEGWKFKFVVECKFYKTADGFSSLFKNPQILSWFDQAKTDAAKSSEKNPLLIFKFNFTDIYVGFNCDPPSTVERLVQVDDLKICLLKDAFLDNEWWKQNT